MHSLLFAVGTLAVTARASYDSKPFDNFVTFGDSYTVSSFSQTIMTFLKTGEYHEQTTQRLIPTFVRFAFGSNLREAPVPSLCWLEP